MRSWIFRIRRGALVAGALLGMAGCSTSEAAPIETHLVHVVEGFPQPEAVAYDRGQDVFFVSSMDGFGSAKDGRGSISRIHAGNPDRVDTFLQSGINGITLNAPKGMALQGDTLWVADIDVLRGFDRRTGAPLATLDLAPHDAVLLNDIAAGPDGVLRVTDSCLQMTEVGVIYTNGSKIFEIGRGGAISVVAQGNDLGHPNGIDWDARERRWVVATFHPFQSQVYAMRPGEASRTVLAQGIGRFDGLQVLEDGRIVVTAWRDSSLHVFAGGKDERAITDLWQPAALGVDTRRDRLAIPLVLQGRVQIWELAKE